MTISRRGLLKALGLGGVGLAVGAGGRLFGQDVFEEEKVRLVGEPLEGGLFDMLEATNWVHPDLDKIDAIMKLTGGYPTLFGEFPAPVHVLNGDRLNINYTITAYGGDKTELQRVYNCVMSLTVLGTSIQGPVLVDANAPNGHRLATVDELVPNEKASIEAYIKHRDLG